MPNIEYRFVVQGRGAFPADMLRYDRCWPARQEDVVTLTLRADRNGPREVTLRSVKAPTDGRWRSFGWLIIDNQTRRP